MAVRRGKTYRTANGQNVDFGAMMLANETAPALGNMNVNARGDEIAPDGTIRKSREQIMREYNEMNTMVPKDDVIPEGTNAAQVDEDDWVDWEPKLKTPAMDEVRSESEGQEAETANTDAIVETTTLPKPKTVAQQIEESTPVEEPAKTPSGGLAAAVAAAKKVEQNVQPAKGTEERETPGVRRI